MLLKRWVNGDWARCIIVFYLIGSCECISIGLGVPPGPPRVSASMKPRTTALRLAVPNSSKVYLNQREREREE